MAWTQNVNPNMATQDYSGWCLRFTQNVYGAPAVYDCARASWDGSSQQQGGTPPAGISAPGYWSWKGSIDGVYKDWGHVAAILADGRVLSSPGWQIGYGQIIFNNVDECSRFFGATYLGWTSEMHGLQITSWSNDPAPQPAPAPAPSGTSCTVEPWPSQNSTLWGIAETFYGDGSRWPEIYSANVGTIGGDPNLIQPGMVLTIPGV